VKNPTDGSMWLTLDGFYDWQQPPLLGEDEHNRERGDLKYWIRAYLVETSDLKALRRWAEAQWWHDDRMPEANADYHVFLGEFFWSPAFNYFDDPYYHRDGWTRDRAGNCPTDVLVTNDEYGREARSYDCSITQSMFVDLPCQYLVKEMKLSWQGEEGNWYDSAKQLIAFDPSIRTAGPRVLLFNRDALDAFLTQRGLSLFWTVSGEKQFYGKHFHVTKEVHHYQQIAGAYFRAGRRILGAIRTRAQ